MVEVARSLIVLIAGLLLLLLGLGLRLQLGTPARSLWAHHLLFFMVTGLSLLAGALLLSAGRGVALLLAGTLLLSMPLSKPGRPAHWQLALWCAAAFGVAAWHDW